MMELEDLQRIYRAVFTTDDGAQVLDGLKNKAQIDNLTWKDPKITPLALDIAAR